jgi:hypothetical protein
MIGPYLRRQFLPEIFSLDVVAAKVIGERRLLVYPVLRARFVGPHPQLGRILQYADLALPEITRRRARAHAHSVPQAACPLLHRLTVQYVLQVTIWCICSRVVFRDSSEALSLRFKIIPFFYNPGSYSAGGQSSCILCAPGTFNGVSNSTSCTACLTAVSVGTSTCGMSFRICERPACMMVSVKYCLSFSFADIFDMIVG